MNQPPSLTLITLLQQELQGIPLTMSAQHIPSLDSTDVSFLNSEERRIVEGYTLPKRRMEWLAGRLCVKEALLAYWQTFTDHPALSATDIQIDYAPSGRPYVKTDPDPSPFRHDISISHSDAFGVAAAAGEQCGIDIQRTTDTLIKVQSQYCSPGEVAYLAEVLPDDSVTAGLGLLWTCKEAIKKANISSTPMGFLTLKLTRLDIWSNTKGYICTFGHQESGRSYTAYCCHNGDYSLALCLTPREHDHA